MEELFDGSTGLGGRLVCAFPKETVAVYQLVKQRKMMKRLRIYRWFLPFLLEYRYSSKVSFFSVY